MKALPKGPFDFQLPAVVLMLNCSGVRMLLML